MFSNTIAFNQPLDGWDVSGLTNIQSMFSAANAFSRDLCSWGPLLDTSLDLSFMFSFTRCPVDNIDPDLTAIPPGPFCYPCGNMTEN